MLDKTARAVHYRNKAEEVRAIAETMNDPERKNFLMGVWSDYIMLAQLMEHMDDPIPASE